MHILIQVVDCKDKDLVITDTGGNTVGWERYETDYCPVLNLTRPGLSQKNAIFWAPFAPMMSGDMPISVRPSKKMTSS